MAVKIRLKRVGKRKQAYFRVVVADTRSPRDGRFIEEIGSYNPHTDPSTFKVDVDRIKYWLDKGAQPSETIRKLLHYNNVLEEKTDESEKDESPAIEEEEKEEKDEQTEEAEAAVTNDDKE